MTSVFQHQPQFFHTYGNFEVLKKSMLNNQGQQKRTENFTQHVQREEIPKIIIRSVQGELKIISNSLNSNNLIGTETTENEEKRKKNVVYKHKDVKNHIVKNKHKLAQAVGGSSASILDNVKQRNRRQSKMYASPSVPLSQTSVLSTLKSMDQLKENNYQTPIPSMTFDSRKTKIDSVNLNYDSPLPSLNLKTISTDYLPSKNMKLLAQIPLDNNKGLSPISSPFDINELEVAAYEEVATSNRLHPSSEQLFSEPGEIFFDVNDAAEEECFEIFSPLLAKEAEKTFIKDHDYLSSIDENIRSDIDIFLEELEHFYKSGIEGLMTHSKEPLVEEKKTDDPVSEMVDLAYQIEKQTNCQGISSKDSAAVSFTFKHSTQARQYVDKIVTDFKNKANSKNDLKIVTKPSRPQTSTDHALSSENRSVVRKQTCATKEKEKKRTMGGRNIVYVGNLPPNYTEFHLRRRFEKFGCIKNIQIKSKVCDTNNSNAPSFESEKIRHFGFITFSCNREAAAAIEGGNAGHKLKFQLSFGARRQFVGEEYRDLDGIVANNENYDYKCNSNTSVLCKKPEEDFDLIYKSYLKDRCLTPQPFRMKCKA